MPQVIAIKTPNSNKVLELLQNTSMEVEKLPKRTDTEFVVRKDLMTY